MQQGERELASEVVRAGGTRALHMITGVSMATQCRPEKNRLSVFSPSHVELSLGLSVGAH